VLAVVEFQRQSDEHAVAIAVAGDNSIQKYVMRGRQQQHEQMAESVQWAAFQRLHFCVQRWFLRPGPIGCSQPCQGVVRDLVVGVDHFFTAGNRQIGRG
jgi:hypothetical protein